MLRAAEHLPFHPDRLFYRFLCLEAVLIAFLFAMQFYMSLPADDGDWPLSILSLINLGFAGCVALFAGYVHRGAASVRRLLFATGVLFLIVPVLQKLLPDSTVDYQDLATLLGWLLSFLLIGFILVRERAPGRIQAIFIAGLLVQGVVILGSATFDDFLLPDVGVGPMDWAYVIGSTFSVLCFLLGFHLFAAGLPGRDHAIAKISHSLQNQRHRALKLNASILLTDLQFRLWRVKFPDAAFADYYAASVKARASPEAKALKAHQELERFRSFGLRPQSICIDYGCGSLKLGRHLIEFVDAAHYIGMDLSGRTLNEGFRLLPSFLKQKRPLLLLISEATLELARNAKPDMVLSTGVLKHTPPEELDSFLENLLSLLQPGTTIILSFAEGANGYRSGSKKWFYSSDFLHEKILDNRPDAKVVFRRTANMRRAFVIISETSQLQPAFVEAIPIAAEIQSDSGSATDAHRTVLTKLSVIRAPTDARAPVSLVDSDVLVHVGLPKTGTTWLQEHLFANTERGFWGPARHEPDPKQQTKAFGRLLYQDAQKRLMAEDDFDPEAVRNILASIVVPEGLFPVISNERLSGHAYSNAFDRSMLAQRIKGVFPNAFLFLAIREQRSMILSSYLQYLKYGGWHSLEGFLAPPSDGRQPALQLGLWNYERLVRFYHSLFGRDRVLVLPYELFVQDPHHYVATICAFVGIPTPEDLPYNIKANPRRSHIASYYLRWLTCINRSSSANGYFPQLFGRRAGKLIDRSIKTAVTAVMPSVWEKALGKRLESQIELFVGDRYAESNRRLGSLIDMDMGAYGYRT